MTTIQSITVGYHRPIYLWAGPGTVRMNQLKFMDAPVNIQVHLQAHTAEGANLVVKEMGCNWVYLMYDWGFPPEIESEDWESFRQAAVEYHRLGAKVFAYIQTSNCVFSGTFQNKDWYAIDSRDQKIYYYTGRYMTCWNNKEWQEHLSEMVRGAIAAGADGIFFDNPWNAGQPFGLMQAWLGPTGCHCPTCKARYEADLGRQIPKTIKPGTPDTVAYLRWRAAQVTQAICRLGGYAKSLRPDIIVSANDFDAVMRPSFLIYGIDLPALAKCQDVIMIEDYGLPLYSASPRPRLANNALTIRTARALVGDTPISVDPYDLGIGFDLVYPARRLQQAIVEAAACGASAVIKGTEFVDQNGVFTLITGEEYTDQRQAIGNTHRWITEQSHLFANRKNLAPIGLYYPGETLWKKWHETAPLFFGAGQSLLAAGIPWKVITHPGEVKGLQSVLSFQPAQATHTESQFIDVTSLSPWRNQKRSLLTTFPALRTVVEPVVESILRGYFSSRWVRKVFDWLGAVRLFTKTALYDLPDAEQQYSLINHLDIPIYPTVEAEVPVLIEVWQQGETVQIHLVNYAHTSQDISVHFPVPVSGVRISPDRVGEIPISGKTIRINIDLYEIILLGGNQI